MTISKEQALEALNLIQGSIDSIIAPGPKFFDDIRTHIEQQAAEIIRVKDLYEIVVGTVAGALERAGVTECDDPGEAIDVLIEGFKARIAELEQREREVLELIDDRDAKEAMADKLARAIAERFGVDIGEHSSGNCPWENALETVQSSDAQGEPVAWMWRTADVCRWNMIEGWDRVQASEAKKFEERGWQVVRLYPRSAPAQQPAGTSFSRDELDLLRQWYNSIKDVNPQYLDSDGFQDTPLYERICALLSAGPTLTQEPVSGADELPHISSDVRSALLFVLWHHQGGSSTIGQAIRRMLGIGQHDRMTDDQCETAKRVLDALSAQAQQLDIASKWRNLAHSFDAQRMLFRDLLRAVANRVRYEPAIGLPEHEDLRALIEQADDALKSPPPAQQPAVPEGWPDSADEGMLEAMLGWRESDPREGLSGEMAMMDRIYHALFAHMRDVPVPRYPIGYISADTLANLNNPAWRAQRGVAEQIWTTDGPPSRALIPVYARQVPAPPSAEQQSQQPAVPDGWRQALQACAEHFAMLGHAGCPAAVNARSLLSAQQPVHPLDWPTDEMVVRGAEALHDGLREAGCKCDFDHDLRGTERQQVIAEQVFTAMLDRAQAANSAMVAGCCGRSECGGECGNEWVGMLPVQQGRLKLLLAAANRVEAMAEECETDDDLAVCILHDYWTEFTEALGTARESLRAQAADGEGQ